ncbi:Asp-tRNA(Asn)/Glu-tRNA(Gln) amidotransferase subunit GatC [uncultured Acinetobacter sp.]|uniref:Asp-tRNA(Asn)/Glu-tRNA(Gln) amidotransferase subunit GatC n=1 Tax=uncultured Acinetobacter sp. TaxID=165433 RepID=UPI00258749DF|nr:Asp-tRNA(Asn)/Glu-tRNA(Gln) amidotransferase subunit GatC [uncultured Acinetobacter sp.]
MSTSDAQHSDLNAQTVSQIANLARLSLNDTQSAEYAQSLNKILDMMESLKSIDTDGVEPLKSPFDTAQPLRQDAVTETNHREEYQSVAPATEAGLYLVPRVIE